MTQRKLSSSPQTENLNCYRCTADYYTYHQHLLHRTSQRGRKLSSYRLKRIIFKTATSEDNILSNALRVARLRLTHRKSQNFPQTVKKLRHIDRSQNNYNFQHFTYRGCIRVIESYLCHFSWYVLVNCCRVFWLTNWQNCFVLSHVLIHLVNTGFPSRRCCAHQAPNSC